MNILLVEDAPLAVMGAKGVLSAFNAIVSVAETGAKALELAATQAFDLILMDIGLPDTDGFTLTRDIHTTCPLNQNTKVIAVTAHAGEDYKPKVAEYGLVGLIVKPLTINNLTETLKEIGVST
jgi:CheY-like chemotaxis protein